MIVPNPNFPTPVWWEAWDGTAPVAATEFHTPDTTQARIDIAERNLGIRAGIAHENFAQKDTLFPTPTTEVGVEQTRGMRVSDGVNVFETNLFDLVGRTGWTLNWATLNAICGGAFGGYIFELTATVKDALTQYKNCFVRDMPSLPPNPTSNFTPVEQYNRFGEIEYCFCSLESCAAHNNLTVAQLRRKLDVWVADSRIQFRLGCPQQPQTTITFPLVQFAVDNKPINQFNTYAEAAQLLECGVSTIHRWVETGETDRFGCFWRKTN